MEILPSFLLHVCMAPQLSTVDTLRLRLVLIVNQRSRISKRNLRDVSFFFFNECEMNRADVFVYEAEPRIYFSSLN